MNKKSYSLRLRLLSLIGIPVVMAGMVMGGLALLSTYHEIDEVYDAQLAQNAKLLLRMTQHELEEHERHGLHLDADTFDFSHFYERKLWYRIWQNGRLITQSREADAFKDLKAEAPGFSRHDIGGIHWRFFVYRDAKTAITVEVAENSEVRIELIMQILASLLMPGIIFLPFILLILWAGTTESLRPIRAIADELNLRNAQDLAPICDRTLPREIAPFIVSLNRLFARVEETFQREREFTDNAAHELRTPLAAMKTQTQVLVKKAADVPACKDGLENLQASINRAGQLIEQLLSFARLQNQNEPMEKLHLSFLTEETLREIHPLAVRRGQSLEAEIEQGLYLQGYAEALGVLLRNLVDNAIKYTPEGGMISVSLAKGVDGIVLTVTDSGSGIAAENKDKVFERFYRVNKSADSGSGLGLSIVRWVADMHHAKVALEDAKPHGLVVRVVF